MTVPEIAEQLAPLIGTSTQDEQSSLNGLNLSDSDKAAMGIAITQGLQEVFALGPAAISEQLHGDVLRAPVNVTFTATQYSTAISAFSGWQDWMYGCTIQGGDGEDNELISATELVRPYMAGSQAGVNATVYADAIKLPSWVKNTMDPVWTPRIPQLRSASNRQEFRFYNSPYIGDPGHRRSPSHGAYYTSRNKTVGEPCVYFVEPRYDPSTSALALFMRFNPMPGQAYPVTFRVKKKPPVITAADIDVSGLVVTGSITPDFTGRYADLGFDILGHHIYAGGSVVASLDFQSGAWQLRDNLSTAIFSYNGPETDPTGTYTSAGGSASGSPVVSFSTGTDLVIPTDWHESILLPFVKRWFIGHPAFQNPATAAQIMQQYQIARATLESFIPQITPTRGNYY